MKKAVIYGTYLTTYELFIFVVLTHMWPGIRKPVLCAQNTPVFILVPFWISYSCKFYKIL